MYTNEESKLRNKLSDVTDMAIDMSRDRRVLLDFVYTAASASSKGEYTHSREDLHKKALDILNELEV